MEKSPLPILTYHDAVLSAHSLLCEAERVHDVKKHGDLKEKTKLLGEYERQFEHFKKRNLKLSDETVSFPEILKMLGHQYSERLMLHLKDDRLEPDGVFDKQTIRGLIENSVLRNWANPVQFKEMKGLVEELLEKRREKEKA